MFLCVCVLPHPTPLQWCYKKILKLQPQSNLKGVPTEFFPNSFKVRTKEWEESSLLTSTRIYILTYIILFLPNFKITLPTFFSASLPTCSGNLQVQKCLDMLVKKHNCCLSRQFGASEQEARCGHGDWIGRCLNLALPATGLRHRVDY